MQSGGCLTGPPGGRHSILADNAIPSQCGYAFFSVRRCFPEVPVPFPQYVVDVFTDRLFHGNPAAVCLPGSELSEALMAAIARENSLPETAFAVRAGDVWRLRWFTPQGEIDFCGHATMAAAFVLARLSPVGGHCLRFESAAGPMEASVSGAVITLDAPAGTLREIPVTEAMARAVGRGPKSRFWTGICSWCSERKPRCGN